MKYYIFNETDGIPGPSPSDFKSRESAQSFIDAWKLTMHTHQGYYKTGGGERIPVDEVVFRIDERPDISPENKLQEILDFDKCKALVETATKSQSLVIPHYVILCPHYSINIQSKYEDGEQLQWDLEELEEYIGGHSVEVSQYDDLVVNLLNEDDE